MSDEFNASVSEPVPDAWLSQDPLPGDPFPILERWQSEAFEARVQPNPHAIALCTVDPDGTPSARMVLCKRIEAARGSIVFYTDRSSRKGIALAHDPRAAAVFHWGPQNRQVRIEGSVTLTSDEDSDDYFASRPADSQIGAWASEQSQPLGSRAELLAKLDREAKRLGAQPGDTPIASLPRPSRWGGYELHATRVELWVSRPGRIHDRAAWTRNPASARAGWQVTRLQP